MLICTTSEKKRDTRKRNDQTNDEMERKSVKNDLFPEILRYERERYLVTYRYIFIFFSIIRYPLFAYVLIQYLFLWNLDHDSISISNIPCNYGEKDRNFCKNSNQIVICNDSSWNDSNGTKLRRF